MNLEMQLEHDLLSRSRKKRKNQMSKFQTLGERRQTGPPPLAKRKTDEHTTQTWEDPSQNRPSKHVLESLPDETLNSGDSDEHSDEMWMDAVAGEWMVTNE